MFSKADFFGEAKQKHILWLSKGLSTVLGTVCVDEHILRKWFLPHSPSGLSGYCFHPCCPDGRGVGQAAGKSLSRLCRKLILGRDIG